MGLDFDWLKQKVVEVAQTAKKGLSETTHALQQATDKAATTTAEKVSAWTGKEISASDVKKAALVAGAVAAVALVVSQQGAGNGQARGGGGGDFESQATMFFGQHSRSLNYETPYVDSVGQVYS